MVHEESGIERLDQLQNLTLAMNEGRTFAQILKSKLPLTDVRVVPYTGSVAKFLLDDSYAQQGYVFSEPLVARRKGGNPRCLMVSELGFDPYTSVVAVTRKTLDEKPELVKRFVAASIRGWTQYLADPAATNRELHRINPDMDLDSLGEAAVAILPLCEVDASTTFGGMNSRRWVELAEQMAAVNAISQDPRLAARAAWTDIIRPLAPTAVENPSPPE